MEIETAAQTANQAKNQGNTNNLDGTSATLPLGALSPVTAPAIALLKMPHTSKVRQQPALVKKVKAMMAKHLVTAEYKGKTFRFHQPSKGEYAGKQWLWDSAGNAVFVSRYNPKLAQDELRALMQHQVPKGLPDAGMIPHMRFYVNDQKIQEFEFLDRSWITQAPLIAVAALKVYQRTPDKQQAKTFLAEMYDGLKQYHEWFDRRRDLDNDGLVTVIHPWETGVDASPAWDNYMPQLSREQFQGLKKKYPNLNKSEFKYEDVNVRLRFSRFYLNDQIRRLRSDPKASRGKGLFSTKPVEYNSIRAADLASLAEIATLLGKKGDATALRAQVEKVRGAIREKMWDTKSGTFRHLANVNGKDELIPVDSAGMFITFFGGVPDKEQTTKLLQVLTDRRKFWGEYPVPTESIDSKSFDPNKYWRGNVWPPFQWLIYEGLKQQSSKNDSAQQAQCIKAANRIAVSFHDLVKKSGFWEYYNPINGKGLGKPDQTWAGLVLEMEPIKR